MNAVALQWVDSATHGDGGWMDIADADPKRHGGALLCHSLGYVIHEDDETLTLASSWSPGYEGEPYRCCGVVTIPKIAIQNRKKVAA